MSAEDTLWQVVKAQQQITAQLAEFTNKLLAKCDKLGIKTDARMIDELRTQKRAMQKTIQRLRSDNIALRMQNRELTRAMEVTL